MAEGIISWNNLSLLVIVFAVLLADIFCEQGSPYVLPTSPLPSNKPNKNVIVTTPSPRGPTSTTPWPTLGTNGQLNQQPVAKSQNQNARTGVQLSYGTNSGQIQNFPHRLNSGNNAGGAYSGLALSYGLGQATEAPRLKTQKQNVVQSSNQNVIKPAQQNASQGAWANAGKTQQVIQNLAPSTTKPNLAPSSPHPTIQNVPSTTGSSKPATHTEKPNSEDEELRNFFEQLIKKDGGNAAQYVTINYQGKTTSRSTTDEAPLPLLDIRPAAYQLPSVSKLLALHNNYILETNVNEHVTPQERLEENDLLDTIIGTPVMQTARNFLVQKGVLSKDPKDFRDKLKEIWFNGYSRGSGKIGSSGFEHVFLAEIKNQEVSGLHNWLYFKDAEAKRLANYLGFMRKLDLGNKGSILKYHFTFNGLDKPVGSMFIGTSPELEIALYSTCFLLKPDQVCPMRFDGKNFIIRTYTFRYRGKNAIGSAFPEI